MQKQNTTQSNKKKQLESQKEKKKNKKIKTSYEQCCQMRKIAQCEENADKSCQKLLILKNHTIL